MDHTLMYDGKDASTDWRLAGFPEGKFCGADLRGASFRGCVHTGIAAAAMYAIRLTPDTAFFAAEAAFAVPAMAPFTAVFAAPFTAFPVAFTAFDEHNQNLGKRVAEEWENYWRKIERGITEKGVFYSPVKGISDTLDFMLQLRKAVVEEYPTLNWTERKLQGAYQWVKDVPKFHDQSLH